MDFENIELDVTTAEVKFGHSRPDFAQVIFHNVAETYPIDAKVECCYTVTQSLTPTSSDWVGLYRVGWSTSKDYICFLWSPTEGITKGKDYDTCVTFEANKLPNDDGEFYQFCYVTKSGQVRGASTPFQFKRPSADDFVEIEDDEGMMIVKSRTVALEDELVQCRREKQELDELHALLEDERESLITKLVDLNRLLQAEGDEKQAIVKELQERQEKCHHMELEAADMMVLHDSLREKINITSQEKDSIESRLDENDKYIKGLQDQIKVLMNEKDALTGNNKALAQELDLLKSHCSNSETAVCEQIAKIESLSQHLAETKRENDKLGETIGALSGEVEVGRKKLQAQLDINKQDKACIDDLQETLRNAEDKLQAAEHCKMLLNEEVTAISQAYEKMSSDLENAKSETHSMMMHSVKQDERWKKTEELARDDMSNLQEKLDESCKESEELRQVNAQLEDRLKRMEAERENQEAEQEGPLFALRTAQIHLKDRYGKMKLQNEEIKKEMDELLRNQRKWCEVETDLRHEVTDLKERLGLAAKEYEKKYIECSKLEKELRKMHKKRAKSTSSSQTCEASPGGAVERDQMQSSAASTTASLPGADGDNSEVADLTSSELQNQLEDLQQELENRTLKKLKYKKLLGEEKDKIAFLTEHYREEVAKREKESRSREKEITKLRERLVAMEAGYDEQVDGMQMVMADQSMQLDLLKAAQGSESSITSQTSQCKPPPSTSYNPFVQEPEATNPFKLKYGNPYQREVSVESSQGQAQGQSEVETLAPEYHPTRLDPPIQPLPPPMEPERLPMAKVAAVRALNEGPVVPTMTLSEMAASNYDQVDAVGGDEDQGDVYGDEAEEKFHDAAGEPQKICPVCRATFPVETSLKTFTRHVEDHFALLTCPMCEKVFGKETNQKDFEDHVQGCLDADQPPA